MNYSHLCTPHEHLLSPPGRAAASGGRGRPGLAAAAGGRRRAEEEAQAGAVHLARRRHEPARKLGPQAEHAVRRAVPGDPDHRPGHSRQRAAAADGQADAPPGGRPQPAHAGQLALRRRGPHPARRSRRTAASPIRTSARPWPSCSAPATAACRRTSGSSRAAAASSTRTPASSARSTARSPSATASRRRTCVRPESLTEHDDDERATSCAAAANARYAKGRRPQMGEANSYVYDMARTLMQRQDLFDTVEVRPQGRRALRHARARPAHAAGPQDARSGRHVREGQLLRLGHARRQLQRPPAA